MRYSTAGDSHGKILLGIIEGLPAGHRITLRDIERDLRRRRNCYGRSTRQKIEKDEVEVVSGLWKGKTSGAPVAILIRNLGCTASKKKQYALGTVPRPGHADLAGAMKYDLAEVPPISERASARGTAMQVAVGAVAKSFLKVFSIDIISRVLSIGGVEASKEALPFEDLKRRVARSKLCCADSRASKKMIEAIRNAKREGHSLGGSVEVLVARVIPGLGSHAGWERKLDTRLAAALMGIPSVKAVEIGEGLRTYKQRGIESHDAVVLRKRRPRRSTNYAGGIEGGISNGENIVARVYAKPLPTSARPLRSLDMRTLTSCESPFVRSDVCAVPALGVIAEAAVAWEILRVIVEKFGGDNIRETLNNFSSYLAVLRARGLW